MGIFSLIGLALFGALFGEIVISDELLRTINSFFNLLTILMIVWHNRHIKNKVEPKVEEIKENTEAVANSLAWDGQKERRKEGP